MRKLSEFKNRTQEVNVNRLGVDERYQRPVSIAKINKIVRDYNPIGIGTILASERSDGTLWVIDGQHRVEALKRLNEVMVEVTIYSGMTLAEEATAFRILQEGSKANAAERYVSELAAGVEETVDIENVINRIGFTVDRHTNKNTIQAADTLKVIYRENGAKNLKETILLINESLGHHRKNFTRTIMLGVSEFLVEYPKADKKWMAKKLQQEGLNSFKNKIDDFNRATGATKKVATVKTLVRIYNHNKSKQRQLSE